MNKDEIGYEPTHPIIWMRLLNPHDHIFCYQRKDGTRYLYFKEKDHDPEEWYEEADGYQKELDLTIDKVVVE